MIESWHSKLKSKYLPYSRNHRVDRVIYVLSQLVERDYRSHIIQVLFNIKKSTASVETRKRKKLANEVPEQKALSMINVFEDHVCI